MFVQRLTAWLSRLAAAVSPHARQQDDRPPERQVVLTRAMGYDHEERSFAAEGSTVSGGWLDDARRLRPHIPRAPLQHAQRWSGKPPLSGPSATGSTDGSRPERSSELPGKAHSTGKVPLPPPSLPPPSLEPAARTQPLPPVPGVPSLPGVPASPRDDASPPDLDQHLQRRLRSLRFLVRHGVYNEGFPVGQAPEQYHFSLGLDPLDSEDSE